MTDQQQAWAMLAEKSLTLCAVRGGQVAAADTASGILPLARIALHHPQQLRGCAVADRITGRAAAMLTAYLGAASLHTGVISVPALQLLQQAGIPVEYQQLVPRIVNRAGDDDCPMEKLAAPLADDDVPGLLQGVAAFFGRLNITV